jgi:hypothetical protein
MTLDPLFDPITIGANPVPNRIFMAPLTRARADADGIQQDFVAEYYAQRAAAGLILSEATGISRVGLGWPNAPGLWNDAQVEAWKPIVEAVHAQGGHFYAQLWHMGRLSHPATSGETPVSPSAIAAPGQAHTPDGKKDYVVPHALTKSEIEATLEDYVRAARNARTAGFDGVQIHGANGYLIDEFLKDSTNHRDDEYGGSPENRVRFLRQVVEAVTGEVGADRTAIRLSPSGEVKGAIDSRPERVFGEAARMLSGRGLSFLELREPRANGTFNQSDEPPMSPLIRQLYDGVLVLNGEYDAAEGAKTIAEGKADAISYGRPFIGNPDLVARFRHSWPLQDADQETWYSNGREGYIDYPVYGGERTADAA